MSERIFLGGAPVVGFGIADPASENCIAKGGTIKIVDVPGGQDGLCVFPDGSTCMEWALFRGECAPGDNRDVNKAAANIFNASGAAGADAGLKAGLIVVAVGSAGVLTWYLLRRR